MKIKPQKALIATKIHYPVDWKILTFQNYQVISGEKNLYPWAGSLVGFSKTLKEEYPRYNISCIDILLEEKEQNIERILQETGESLFLEIAYRNNRRFVRKIEPFSFSSEKSSLLRQGGVYLIIGGAKGVGREIALFLARRVKARLVLGTRESSFVLTK